VLLAGITLLEAGDSEQKKQWLQPLATGELKGTLALIEQSGRWDAAGVQLRAIRSNRGYSLTGTKLFVPDADVSNLIICAARTSDEADAEKGITLLAVDRKTEGLRIAPLATMDQTRRLYEVNFQQVEAPDSRIVGQIGDGWPVIEKALDKATVGLCANMIGASSRVLEMCVEYSKSRIQFGRPIGTFQSIQHRCADMLLVTESARSAVYAAAWAASQPSERVALFASIAKAYTSDAFSKVAAEGIQIHGGMGFTWEHDAHLYLKRAKADEVTFGDASYHRERVASLIGL
jgi:alkylation response protein AidB-like acyl-CoA dehydrogenase